MKYLIGLIKNTHGLKGEVLVKSLSDFNRFVKDEEIFLIDNEIIIPFKIKGVKQSNKGSILSFYSIDNISQIEKYKGYNLYTNKRPHLEEDEYHVEDLISKEVYDQKDNYIGVVKEVVQVPQGQILRVATESKDILIPFNDVFIEEVSTIIKVNVIEGLV